MNSLEFHDTCSNVQIRGIWTEVRDRRIKGEILMKIMIISFQRMISLLCFPFSFIKCPVKCCSQTNYLWIPVYPRVQGRLENTMKRRGLKSRESRVKILPPPTVEIWLESHRGMQQFPVLFKKILLHTNWYSLAVKLGYVKLQVFVNCKRASTSPWSFFVNSYQS